MFDDLYKYLTNCNINKDNIDDNVKKGFNQFLSDPNSFKIDPEKIFLSKFYYLFNKLEIVDISDDISFWILDLFRNNIYCFSYNDNDILNEEEIKWLRSIINKNKNLIDDEKKQIFNYLDFLKIQKGFVVFIDICGSTEFLENIYINIQNKRSLIFDRLRYFYWKVHEKFYKQLQKQGITIESIKYIGDEIMYFIPSDSFDKIDSIFKMSEDTIKSIKNESSKENLESRKDIEIKIAIGFSDRLRFVKQYDMKELIGPDLALLWRIKEYLLPNMIMVPDKTYYCLDEQKRERLISAGKYKFKGFNKANEIFFYNYDTGIKDENNNNIKYIKYLIDELLFIDSKNLAKETGLYFNILLNKHGNKIGE